MRVREIEQTDRSKFDFVGPSVTRPILRSSKVSQGNARWRFPNYHHVREFHITSHGRGGSGGCEGAHMPFENENEPSEIAIQGKRQLARGVR